MVDSLSSLLGRWKKMSQSSGLGVMVHLVRHSILVRGSEAVGVLVESVRVIQ